MAIYPVAESAQFVGDWFIPTLADQLDSKIPGTLVWEARRGTLALHDTFTPSRGAIFGGQVHEYAAIHGVTTGSDFVSVLNANQAGSGIAFGPAGIKEAQKLIASWVVVGAHVNLDTSYLEIKARIPRLELWIGRSGVTQTLIDKSESTPATVVYAIEGLKEESTPIESPRLNLCWEIGRQFGGDRISSITVSTSGYLTIRTDEPRPLPWLIAELGKATTLLSFLAGSPMAPDQFSAKLGLGEAEVQILVALRESATCEYKHVHDFFLRRNGMGASLNEVFARWFEIYDSVAMPSQLALSVLSANGQWLHVEFLSVMQALEGLHRSMFSGLYVSPEDYAPIAESLTKAIPNTTAKDHRDALKARIKYGNEISLRKRLDDLVANVSPDIRQMILGGDGAVPRSWINTRNYYTHWDESSRSLALDGLEMHRAIARLKLLLRVLYLDMVGIPTQALEDALRGANSEAQYLIQLNAADQRRSGQNAQAGVMMHINVADPESPDTSAA